MALPKSVIFGCRSVSFKTAPHLVFNINSYVCLFMPIYSLLLQISSSTIDHQKDERSLKESRYRTTLILQNYKNLFNLRHEYPNH